MAVAVDNISEAALCFLVLPSGFVARSEPSSVDTLETALSLRTPSIYLAQNGGRPSGKFLEFDLYQILFYPAYCDDFGPMNLLSIIEFIELLDEKINDCLGLDCIQLVCQAEKGRRSFTNAAFLLGAYMILKLGSQPEAVDSIFAVLNPRYFELYRDATYAIPDFRLRLIDCWQGLHRGNSFGWVAMPTTSDSPDWGQVDREAYAHYNDPLNADLHEVVPQKFIAFRGPRDLEGPTYVNNFETRSREFDPRHYVDIFQDFGVSTIIRLNEPTYSASVFSQHGMEHFDLYFDDCIPPPPAVVKSFFEIVDRATGVIAVHCKAGLGRTGTLIALYLMRSHGFTAREAMGWLRIMRPGCVIGDQQHFLCRVDIGMRGLAAAGRLPSDPVAADLWARRGHDSGTSQRALTPPPDNNSLRSYYHSGAGERRTGSGERDERQEQHARAEILAEQVSSGIARRDQARADWLQTTRMLPGLAAHASDASQERPAEHERMNELVSATSHDIDHSGAYPHVLESMASLDGVERKVDSPKEAKEG